LTFYFLFCTFEENNFLLLNKPMKKRTEMLLYLIGLGSVVISIVSGCQKMDTTDPNPETKDPYAMFEYTRKPNGIVSFTNTSHDATSYLWDFGDLTTSTTSAETFEHQYLQNGLYHVTLTAYGNGTSTGAYADLNITTVVSETVTDIDGNVYHTVTIGTQVWMVENLKTTHYRNGNPIPNVTVNTAWNDLTTGAYCDYDNDASNSIIYGRLYNWYAVSDNRNIAPTGWHVATNTEWITLTTYLGGSSVAGGKMKSIGTIEAGTGLWHAPNTGATNESGFTAVPAGLRYYYGPFDFKDYYSRWWTSSEDYTDYAWSWLAHYTTINIGNGSDYEGYGCSVRCVRD